MKKKRHIIITGAGKGIGRAAAEVFLREGATVSGLDIDVPDGTKEVGPDFTMYKCDVSRFSDIIEAISKASRKNGPVDVLVNNAGINRYGTVTETSEELWDQVMNTNLKSAFLSAKAVLPMMKNSGHGVIINVASVQAFVSQDQVAAYTTSKSALLGLTRSIAIDYGPEVRCVAVCPGTIDTPMLQTAIRESPDPEAVLRECEEMHVLKRIGTAEEVGELIAYLASDKAAFITGQAIRIDGGLGIAVGGSRQK